MACEEWSSEGCDGDVRRWSEGWRRRQVSVPNVALSETHVVGPLNHAPVVTNMHGTLTPVYTDP